MSPYWEKANADQPGFNLSGCADGQGACVPLEQGFAVRRPMQFSNFLRCVPRDTHAMALSGQRPAALAHFDRQLFEQVFCFEFKVLLTGSPIAVRV
jgi:hypothetical protein